ncbi:hypothetical protein [Barrientosiimonas humi]|uniref:hypothetical protein n=1 Tax=Barrientosiimonas humi TaxID=999931 RepID=UPI00370DBEF1
MLLAFLTTQHEIELARFDRALGRLGRFQTAATVPLVVIGGVVAAARADMLSTLQWTLMLIDAFLLLVPLVIAIAVTANRGGVAALKHAQLMEWKQEKYLTQTPAAMRGHVRDATLNAIKRQEEVNQTLWKAWVWASGVQAVALGLALLLALSLVYPSG